MSTLVDANVQATYAVKLQKGVRHNMLKIFECPQCGLTFDRASQLGYHHRSIHLGERSQVCQICGKGFFRKTDLRTHLNIHLGTNFCICEFCGRKFNHISNLIRHCRVHAGVKPYLCSICDRRFTQVSSLVRHKHIIHGIPKETMRQYCNSSHVNNKSHLTICTSKENKTKDNNIESNYHEKVNMESKCQNTNKELNVQVEKVIDNHNSTENTSVEEDNLTEIENRLSQDSLTGIEEKFESIDLSTIKAVSNFQSQETNDNQEQIQSKDNIIYLHQLDRNSFTFLPRDRGPNTESQIQNDENTVRSNDTETRAIRYSKSVSVNDVKGALNVETNLQMYNSDEVISEDKKCDKLLNDDNQLYIELSELGLLKLDESRCSNNTDSISTSFSHVEKSQYSTDVTADDLTYILAATQSRDSLAHNEDSTENLDDVGNIVLNKEEPMLRLVQTETGELFYELIISELLEKMQSTTLAENTKNEIGKAPSSIFEHYEKTDSQNSNEADRTEHHHALDDLTDINNEFNYTQFDLHGEENFAVLCDNESEHFQQGSRENECITDMQEKSLQAYDGNLELLEDESHVDFEKYVETNFEVFERLNYENCSEKLLELVEVADIGAESLSECKESSTVCLVQNDSDQLLELLQDCQITEQDTNFTSLSNLRDENCSSTLQHSNDEVTDSTRSKLDFFAFVENNVSLQDNMNSGRSPDNDNYLDTNLIINNDVNISKESAKNENRVNTSDKPKKSLEKPKISSKKFQCSVCKKAFSTAYNYKQHIGIHFTDQQKFHCKECGASFAWKSTLNKHIASNHSSDEQQKYTCEICAKSYNTFSQVNEHVKRDHLKQRNHVCLHCGKSFFKSFDLKTHSRTHTNERPYMCRVCGKRFHHQSHIIRHERTHSGERPYTCDICQKTFMQLGSLKTHKQKHRQVGMNVLNYQVDEDDPIALMAL